MNKDHPLIGLSPFLYDEECSNIPQVLDQYIASLKTIDDPIVAQSATIQQQYKRMVTNTRFLSQVRKHFNKIYKALSNMGLFFKLDGRRKSLFSFENKVNLAIENSKPLDSIRDIFAFRIILFDTPKEDMIDECYSVLKKLCAFLSKNGFIPCEATKFVSSHSAYIKDYIQNPKDSGYRSLHSTFFHPETGNYFEVQIRTLSMHVIAERGSASHKKYKSSKYNFENVYDGIDLSKVNLRGFWFCPDETGEIGYIDEIGLIDSINILTRQRTF